MPKMPELRPLQTGHRRYDSPTSILSDAWTLAPERSRRRGPIVPAMQNFTGRLLMPAPAGELFTQTKSPAWAFLEEA